MIRFKELRITPDEKELIINVSIDDIDYYREISISSIVIDTQDTYIEGGPSKNAIYSIDVNSRSIRVVVDLDNLPKAKDNLLFVYVLTSGDFDYNTPVEYKKFNNVGVVFNTYPIYKNAMIYTKELATEGSVPKGFIDQILKIKALELSIKTGNNQEVIKYWNKLFKKLNSEC